MIDSILSGSLLIFFVSTWTVLKWSRQQSTTWKVGVSVFLSSFSVCMGSRRFTSSLFLKFTFLWLCMFLTSFLPPPSSSPLLQCIPCGRDPSRYQEVIVSLPSTSLCERASSTQRWSLWSQIMTRRPANKSGTTVTPFWSSMMTLQTSPVSSPLCLLCTLSFLRCKSFH